MMLFIIVPITGLAIDGGILYTIKAKLQSATDGASLGAARSLNRGQDIASQQTAATDTAIRYYHANFPANWMGVTTVNDPTVTWPVAPNPATAIINVQGDLDAPTWFMRVLGVNTVHVTATGQATRRDVNVLLVIDRSGSLQTSGSCGALASSAQLFVSSFSNNRDRMGLVTFGTYYNIDFPFNFDFQTGLTNKLSTLACVGWTNAAAAYWKGYQMLKTVNAGGPDLNALNVILFFTDGQPNTITYGTGDGGTGPLITPAGGCQPSPAAAGFSGTVGGNADGIYTQTNSTYPAPNPDQFMVGSTGCGFTGRINTVLSTTDIPSLPPTDAFGNSVTSSLLGGSGFPASVTLTGGNVRISSTNVTNGGINALDNAAQRARQDASASNMPFIVYTVGLGNSGGVNDELLKRIANDRTALAYQSAYTSGTYIYTPDTAHLAQAFGQIADDIMRLSK
jgi:Flp pilus assembly protein TadG